jgi:hypothetical protein
MHAVYMHPRAQWDKLINPNAGDLQDDRPYAFPTQLWWPCHQIQEYIRPLFLISFSLWFRCHACCCILKLCLYCCLLYISGRFSALSYYVKSVYQITKNQLATLPAYYIWVGYYSRLQKHLSISGTLESCYLLIDWRSDNYNYRSMWFIIKAHVNSWTSTSRIRIKKNKWNLFMEGSRVLSHPT